MHKGFIVGLFMAALMLGTGVQAIEHSVSSATPKFSCSSTEQQVIDSGAARVDLFAQRIYIGTRQVSANNQNPIVRAFGSPAWCREDYEQTGVDGRGQGLFFDGGNLYGFFSVDGGSTTAFTSAASGNQRSWTRSYGSGGGPKVAVVARINPADGSLTGAAFLPARLESGKSNSSVIQGASISGGSLVLTVSSFFSPRNPDGSRIVPPDGASSPFPWVVTMTPDLTNVTATYATFLGTTLSAPVGTIPANPSVSLVWDEDPTATSYQVNVYDPYQSIFNQGVPTANCIAGTCSVNVYTGSVVGDYDVWILAQGTGSDAWTLNEFSMALGGTSISTVGGFGETVPVSFPQVRGAGYTVLDVYRPNSYDRYVVESSACQNDVCSFDIPSLGERGAYDVWMIPGLGASIFGTWRLSSINVTFADVTLTSPTGTEDYEDSYDLEFALPYGAYFAVVDIYWPNGGYAREVVEAPACPNSQCVVTIPSYGLGGDYGVWIVPGWGGSFGNWAYSSFTVMDRDLTTDAVDTLGSAAEAPPALDTSQVEAAVEGPGN